MASEQVVETSVTNNSPSQDSNHPDDLCQCVLVSCKQWFAGCCFRVLPSNREKVTVLLNLLSKLDTRNLFVQLFLEFVNFVFVYRHCCEQWEKPDWLQNDISLQLTAVGNSSILFSCTAVIEIPVSLISTSISAPIFLTNSLVSFVNSKS